MEKIGQQQENLGMDLCELFREKGVKEVKRKHNSVLHTNG